MMLLIVCVIVGVMVGYTWATNDQDMKYKKTVEQVDEQLRKDLEYHKNLNQSLQQDVTFLREKIKRLTAKD